MVLIDFRQNVFNQVFLLCHLVEHLNSMKLARIRRTAVASLRACSSGSFASTLLSSLSSWFVELPGSQGYMNEIPLTIADDRCEAIAVKLK